MKCSVEPCLKEVFAKGYCRYHYDKNRKYGDPLYDTSIKLAPCGTRTAYNRHLRLGEDTCQPCRDAQAEYCRKASKTDSARARFQIYNLYARTGHKLTGDDLKISHSYRMAIMSDSCFYCKGVTSTMHTDHKVPLSRGGTDHWWNLCRACSKCNNQKGKMTEQEYRTWLSAH